LKSLIVDFEVAGIGIGMWTFRIKLGSIAAVFGEVEADAMLSVELSTVNALLAGAYVEVMLSQV
jgi:hypothetical protein